MPPRIDGLTWDELRGRIGRLYADNEPVGEFQGLWTEPEELTPPPERRYIDPRLFGERPAYQTVGIDLSAFEGTFLQGFAEEFRKKQVEDEEYKKALDKQWNELMFGQAQ